MMSPCGWPIKVEKVRFPLELLVPQLGHMTFNKFGGSIEIPLAPFELPDHGTIETKILIDCITLPTHNPELLSGKTFSFPLNPADGCAEGSVYMGYHHHPVDLLHLGFVKFANGEMDVKFAVGIAFDFEGLSAAADAEYDNIGWQFDAKIVFSPAFSKMN